MWHVGWCVACVFVVPASLARHFDDVDLRYFYFSQSIFASLHFAATSRRCWHIELHSNTQQWRGGERRGAESFHRFYFFFFCVRPEVEAAARARWRLELPNCRIDFLCYMCQLVKSEHENTSAAYVAIPPPSHHRYHPASHTPLPEGLDSGALNVISKAFPLVRDIFHKILKNWRKKEQQQIISVYSTRHNALQII